MNKAKTLFVLAFILTGCSQPESKPAAEWSTLPVCKVAFGKNDSTTVVLFRRSETELLIHRDGNPASTPESYPMPKNRLAPEAQIAPFKVGKIKYNVTNITEYVDTKPAKKHALMIFVEITDETTSYSQYCEVELKANLEKASAAQFDGPLTIGPQTTNYTPDKLEIPIGGKPVDFRVHIGTIDKSSGCYTVVKVHDGEQCKFDEKSRPVLRIDFPTANGTKLRKTFSLDEFC